MFSLDSFIDVATGPASCESKRLEGALDAMASRNTAGSAEKDGSAEAALLVLGSLIVCWFYPFTGWVRILVTYLRVYCCTGVVVNESMSTGVVSASPAIVMAHGASGRSLREVGFARENHRFTIAS
jgi:hypothetical protein